MNVDCLLKKGYFSAESNDFLEKKEGGGGILSSLKATLLSLAVQIGTMKNILLLPA